MQPKDIFIFEETDEEKELKKQLLNH